MAKNQSTEIVIDQSAGIAYLPNGKAIVKLTEQPQKTPTGPVPIDFTQTEYKPWGDDNDLPGSIIKRAEKNSIIPSTLMWKVNQMSAGGVEYGTVTGRKPDGTEIFEALDIPEIDDWLEANAMDLYQEESLRDLYWFANAFPDLYLNRKRNKIASLITQEATDCRYSKMNKKGKKELVYVDGNWPMGKESTWTKVACLDPYFDVKSQIAKSTETRFILPISFSSPGQKYYQKASWHSIIDSGWLDVADKIPVFKKSLMDNQMSIKYVINVPESWWKWKYKKWDQMNDGQKKAAQVETLREFNDVLTGVKNAGKTLMLTFKHDSYGKQYTKWEVIPLADKIQTGTYVEDSQEVSSHILYSLLVDGTLIGNSPGKGMGAGSGSDKLRASNIFVMSNKVYVDKSLSPMKLITSFNNWKGKKGEKVVWRSVSYMLATLDSGKTMAPNTGGQDPAKQADNSN